MMAFKPDTATAISAGVSKLQLQAVGRGEPGKASGTKAKRVDGRKAVAESWDDNSLSSDSESESGPSQQAVAHRDGTAAPPPTPIAPNHNLSRGFGSPSSGDGPASSDTRRPEKTDAAARRMISAGLGLKAPKLTEEQRAYEKAVKEKERKRREQEKEAERRKEEETAKARAAIWED
jgi:hypothetical protein